MSKYSVLRKKMTRRALETVKISNSSLAIPSIRGGDNLLGSQDNKTRYILSPRKQQWGRFHCEEASPRCPDHRPTPTADRTHQATYESRPRSNPLIKATTRAISFGRQAGCVLRISPSTEVPCRLRRRPSSPTQATTSRTSAQYSCHTLYQYHSIDESLSIRRILTTSHNVQISLPRHPHPCETMLGYSWRFASSRPQFRTLAKTSLLHIASIHQRTLVRRYFLCES